MGVAIFDGNAFWADEYPVTHAVVNALRFVGNDTHVRTKIGEFQVSRSRDDLDGGYAVYLTRAYMDDTVLVDGRPMLECDAIDRLFDATHDGNGDLLGGCK